jgi:tRNA U55 pseudouridine synthase TruB
MASGKLIVLVGDECKNRSHYDGLDKTYVFEVLLGFLSDTGDVLGMPESFANTSVSEQPARDVAHSLVGTHTFRYPVFSSRTVAGKPLYQYALEKKLDTIEVPTVEVEVYSLRYKDKIVIPRTDVIERVLDKIEHLAVDANDKRLGSDFRKDTITKAWWSLHNKIQSNCTILRFEATVSSGTYIRTLAPLIAERLGTVGLAYSIHRTRIGRYLPITRRIGFWMRSL